MCKHTRPDLWARTWAKVQALEADTERGHETESYTWLVSDWAHF